MINEIRSIEVKVPEGELERTLIDIAKSQNPFVSTKLEDDAKISDFFDAYIEGSRELENYFSVQRRMISGGRLGISYENLEEGYKLKSFVMDNGENISEEKFEIVYERVKDYFIEKEFEILNEKSFQEY